MTTSSRSRLRGGIVFTRDTGGVLIDGVTGDDIEVWMPEGYEIPGGIEILAYSHEQNAGLARISIDTTLVLKVPKGSFSGPGSKDYRGPTGGTQ